MKVVDITADSNMQDFIDYYSIQAEVDTIRQSLNIINENIVDVLNREMKDGGLDLYSANIDGSPVFHTKAGEVVDGVNLIYTDFSEQLDNVDKQAKEHRINELTTFIAILEAKIKELESQLEYAKSSLEYWEGIETWAASAYRKKPSQGNQNTRDNAHKNINERRSEIKEINKQLDGGLFGGGYRQKLEEAKAALNQIN